MTTPPVTIVVLTWNGLAYTKKCLETLRQYTVYPDYHIVVVDNGSTDGTLEYLRGCRNLAVIANERNVGFAAANNQAIRQTPPDADIVLLNNDTEILPECGDWLQRMSATAYSADDIGIVGCRIRRPNGMLQHAGAYMPLETFWGQQIGSMEKDVNQYAGIRDVESVVFACVYLKRAVIDAIGLLSEDYFAYFEDTDYCLRARQAGFRTVCSGDVTIIHHENVSTSENRVSHADLFKRSQGIFKKHWGQVLAARYDMKAVWHSTVTRPHGYGMTSKDLLLELDRQNVEMTYRYLYGRGTVFPVEEPENTTYYQVNIMKQRAMPRGVPHIVYGQGDAFMANDGAYKIGYTMLEVSGIPDEWVVQANMMDEVWVPTDFNRHTFLASGVKKPIYVMPLGVDTNYFNPQIVKYPVCDDFKFLTVFEWGERKAPELLLKTFNETFMAHEPVVLLCKANVTDPGIDIQSELRALQLSPAGGRIEFIINKYVPHYQLGSLYRSCDCFVLTSRGEGWGMPILEAMACGLPVIATYWSAPTAFMTEANSYPLQVRALIPAVAKCPYYAGFKWADPDADHLRHLLRHVYSNQEEARAKGARAAQDAAMRWSVERAAANIRARLAEIARTRGVSAPHVARAVRARAPRIAIDISRAIGEQITGVGRYARNLVEGLARSADQRFEYVLLPGFGSFVHPEYGRRFHAPVPAAPNISLYRGPLPACASRETIVPDVALVHSTAYMAPRHCGAPLVYTVHDLSFLTHPQFHTSENIDLCRENIERAVKRDATLVAVSEHTRQDLIGLLHVAPERIHVVYNTYDDTIFHPCSAEEVARVRAKLRLPERYLLFVASLEPRKNLSSVLAALQEHDPGCPLVIAGARGWLNTPLDRQIAACGTRVRLVGYVADHDLAALYAGARALVYPSLHEGFGLPVLEAMACGTPVITTRVSSLPEVVGEAGVLLDNPEDIEALAASMCRLADDDEACACYRAAGLARARRFNLSACTSALLQLYSQLVEV